MIVFQVIEHHGTRSVVHELRSAIKVTGVVLVGFHHKEGGIPQPCRDREIRGSAANQESRRHAGVF